MWNLFSIKRSAFVDQMRYLREILSSGLFKSSLNPNAEENKINGMVSSTGFKFFFFESVILYFTYHRDCRQCSECDKNSSSSDNEHVDTEAPRKLRRGSKERRDSKNEVKLSARL